MSSSILTPLLILASAGIFILCDSLAAVWGKEGKLVSLILVILLAPLGFIVFGVLNRRYQLALLAGWVNVATAIGTTLVGLLIFNEQLTGRQLSGVVIAVLGIFLMMTR